MITEYAQKSTSVATDVSTPWHNLAALAAENEVKPVQSTLADLLDHITKAPNKNALQADLMKNVSQYAALTEPEIEQVRIEAERLGVTATWWSRDFKPALRRQTQASKSTDGVTLSEKIKAQLKGFGYEFSHNLCTGDILVNGEPINDGIAATIRVKMRDAGTSSIKAVEDVCAADAHQNSFHPVRQYLDSLQWDGSDHIAALAHCITDSHEPLQYADGTQRAVFHAFLRRWLIGAVTRAYCRNVQPPMLVLSGAQGKGKSYLAKWLCPLPDMFIESAIYPDNKDHLKWLAGRWIWAVDELGATTRRADIEGLKAFITKDMATFRAAWGRYDSNLIALASFIGTVNDSGAGFLNDPTGNRRFAVVDVQDIDHSYSKTVDLNQVWAQATALYRAGEPWQLDTEEAKVSATNSESHQATDPVMEVIAQHFEIDQSQRDWQMTTDEIMDCLIESHKFRQSKDKAFSTAIGIALKKLGAGKERFNRVRKYVGIKHVPNKPQ